MPAGKLVIISPFNCQPTNITPFLNGGLSSRRNPKSYTYFSDTIHLLPATKPGYEFVGWFDKRGNELNVIREHSMGNKHLIAQFRKREFD